MIRRIALVTIAALSIAACSNETTAPDGADIAIEAGAFGTELTLAGGYDAALYPERLINALPDELKLSDEQKTKIRNLVTAFQSATREDREALGAILRQAREAAQNGGTREEVQAILRTGAPIRGRLAAAEKDLVEDIHAVLTPEQRAWILAHRPARCEADKFPPLTDAQKEQIRALELEFREDNRSDLDSMRVILAEARAAFQAGKSREEIAAILARGAAIAQRLATARKDLREDILAILTPEQKASRCFPLG